MGNHLRGRRLVMRNRSIVVCVLSLFVIFTALGCSKSEAPKPEAPPAPAAAPAPAPETAAPASAPGTPAAPAAGGAAAEGKVLFEQKCGVCHDLARAADRKETRENWAGIVKDMQGKKAGWISDAEASRILDFLVAEHGKK